jgi:hypothetical protein
MSIKTLRKRIALVAVSALGVGLLSVAPASAANETFDSWAGSTVCDAATVAGADVTDLTSGSTIYYITMPVGAKLVLKTTADEQLRVTAPLLITQATGGTIAADGLSSTGSGGTAADINITATAVGTGSAKMFVDATDTTASDTVVITVVASCANGTISLNNSFIEAQTSAAPSTADDNVDDAQSWADGETARISMVIKNSYQAAVPLGTWVVSATNGALVGIAADSTTTGASCGDTSAASVSADGSDIQIAVCQGTDYAAQTSTVTVSYGSTTVLTRTVLITGDVSKITVSSVEVGRAGVQTYRVFKASAYDAAGNRVAVNPSADVTTLDQNVTAADIGTTLTTGDTQNSNYITCSAAAAGAVTNVKFKVTANSGATVYSDAVPFSCGSALYTYTASLDKATYVPGDIATLTITYKDIYGKTPYDGYNAAAAQTSDDVVQYVNGSNVAPSISGSQMTAVATPAAGDTVSGGVKTYQFVVGSTEGSYQMAVNLTGITTDKAKAVAYSVKSSTTTVTDAELLAAIVKLIASINKQIKALQKSLRR